MAVIECTYRLQFGFPVSVFTGLGIAGLIDRTVMRNELGLPYIPGSTVKGRLRFFAERILRSSPPNVYAIHTPEQSACSVDARPCTACRLFGAPSHTALVSVGPAVLEPLAAKEFLRRLQSNGNRVVHADAEIRPGIGVSRLRRASLPEHLFFDETVPAACFVGHVLLDSLKADETRFFAGVGKLVDAVGARKAVGRGALLGGVRFEGIPT